MELSALSGVLRIVQPSLLAAGYRLALVGLAAGALAGCTALAGASPSNVTVHQQDFGHAIVVHVDDTITLDLLDSYPIPGSSTVWTADSANAAILQRISSTREAVKAISKSHGHYTAVFKARALGSATIKAIGAARCEAMNPAFCPQPSGTIPVTVEQP